MGRSSNLKDGRAGHERQALPKKQEIITRVTSSVILN